MLNCTQQQNDTLKELTKKIVEIESIISVAFAINRFQVLFGDESLKCIFNLSPVIWHVLTTDYL